VLLTLFLMESIVAFFASFNACGIPRFMCLIFNLKVCICGLFCMLPVYMGCAPCTFNKLILPIKKKKKTMTYLYILPSMASIFCVDEFYLRR
jgi:hypothetical protein